MCLREVLKERCRQGSEMQEPYLSIKTDKRKNVLTATTLNVSIITVPWRPSIGLGPLKHHHHVVLTGHLYSLKRTTSCRDGWTISTVSQTGPLLLSWRLDASSGDPNSLAEPQVESETVQNQWQIHLISHHTAVVTANIYIQGHLMISFRTTRGGGGGGGGRDCHMKEAETLVGNFELNS